MTTYAEYMEAVDALVEALEEVIRELGRAFVPLIGDIEATRAKRTKKPRTRHTYPRPKREWWVR